MAATTITSIGKHKKYIPCSGLAFEDQEDMNLLHAYAQEGWIFKDFRFGCYVLHREAPQNLIYSYDMRKLKQDEKEDYFTIYKEAGWHFIKSSGEIHFFTAQEGSIRIHSEQETRNEQYRSIFYICLVLTIIGTIMLVAVFRFADKLGMATSYLGAISGGMIGGCGILCVGSYWRMNGKRLKLRMRFQTGVYLFVIGLIFLILGRVFDEMISELRWLRVLVSGGGFICIIEGLIFMISKYRVFLDKKEQWRKQR